MSQIKSTPMALEQYMGQGAFVMGYRDGQTGKPWARHYERFDTRDQWLYENGRFLGVVNKALPLFSKGKLSREAKLAFVAASCDGTLVVR